MQEGSCPMPSQSKLRVLVTGMSGLIGSSLHEMLPDKYEWSALNRRDVPGVPTTQADIADLDAIRPAFDGRGRGGASGRDRAGRCVVGRNYAPQFGGHVQCVRGGAAGGRQAGGLCQQRRNRRRSTVHRGTLQGVGRRPLRRCAVGMADGDAYLHAAPDGAVRRQQGLWRSVGAPDGGYVGPVDHLSADRPGWG